jgi:hypothetical protein
MSRTLTKDERAANGRKEALARWGAQRRGDLSVMTVDEWNEYRRSKAQ